MNTHVFTCAQAQVSQEGMQILLELIRKQWSDTNIIRKLKLASQNIFESLTPENKFSYTHKADLWCCFDPLFAAPLPPGTRYHFWFCILSVWIVFLLSWSQWSYLTGWLWHHLTSPGGYLHISLTMNLFLPLNQHWIKWRHEPYSSVNQVQELYTGGGTQCYS